jgi:eukaryotic-like serine/threonine-protein kinase
MQRERRRVGRWVPWVSWLGILGGVVALVVISTRPSTEPVTRAVTHEPPGPVVPDVDGMRVGQAREALERAGFWVRTAREPSARTPRGRIVGTSPPVATGLRVGAQVTLLISSGRPRVRVPSLQGLSRSEAEERLLRAGFRVVVVRRESLDPPGAVIGQSPDSGRRVRASSVVRLAVAARATPVAVPAVTGMDFERAVEEVSARGLAISFEHRRARRAGDVGRVLAQSLPGGQRAPRGARVTLTVGVER